MASTMVHISKSTAPTGGPGAEGGGGVKQKNLKSLAGLEAEISMEQTDARKCEHISVTTIVGYAKNIPTKFSIL